MTSPLRAALRDQLRTAMRARDRQTVGAMRNILAALENAEAVPVQHGAPGATSDHVAGSVVGLGAGEAPRRSLTPEDERSVVDREIAELRSASAELATAGQHERSTELLQVAAAVEQAITD